MPQNSNPGSILNQQLQNLYEHPFGPAPGPGVLPPVLSAPKPKPAPKLLAPGVHFVLRGVKINKSDFLKPAALAAIYQPYIGKTVQFSDLQKIVEEINALYRAKGVVTAQAVLPPQRIVSGVVRVNLIEGKVGEVKIEGNSITRSSYIRERISAAPGQVVDAKKLEHDLILFNRTNRTQLHANLEPGTSFGLTNILLRATEPVPARIDIFADNEGVDSTGASEIGAFIRDNKIFGFGDSLEFYAVKSRGSTTGNVYYSIPINAQGGTMGYSLARGRINVVSGPGQPLGITGSSWTSAIDLVQPVYVTGVWKISGALNFARDASNTSLSGQALGTTLVDKTSVGLRTQYISPIRYSLFTLSITPESAHGADNLGSATVYDGTFSVEQRLPKPFARYFVMLKSALQYVNRWTVAPAEFFTIGGANSVRGYTQGLLSGAKGYYAQLELHRSFSHHIDGFLFADSGGIYTSTLGRQVITGVGTGFAWAGRNLTTSLSVGYGTDRNVSNRDDCRVNLRVAWNTPLL